MTQEEKAKRYDEAYKKVAVRFGSNVADEIFPELKESEDERIRKDMIETIKKEAHDFPSSVIAEKSNSWIAWLEKQGEQKTEVKYVYTKFQIGDTIVEIKPNGYCQPVRVKYIGDGAYSCESDDGKRSLSFPIINQDDYELVEQKHAWSEEDEKILELKTFIAQCNGFNKVNRQKAFNLIDALCPHNTWKPSDE